MWEIAPKCDPEDFVSKYVRGNIFRIGDIVKVKHRIDW